MVHIDKYRGEFGNRLFQYAFGRVLSMRMGTGIEANYPDEHLDTYHDEAKRDFGVNSFVTDDNSDFVYDSGGRECDYRLWGFFQKYRYYRDYKREISGWFSPKTPPPIIGQSDVVVHIRRGDYLGLGEAIDLGYYVEIMRDIRSGVAHFVVIGRGVDDKTKKALKEFRPIYSENGYWNDYGLLLRAPRIIMSNSTFAWWGAWLSVARDIWFPVPKRGYFSDVHEHQQLRVEESRYHYVDGVEND